MDTLKVPHPVTYLRAGLFHACRLRAEANTLITRSKASKDTFKAQSLNQQHLHQTVGLLQRCLGLVNVHDGVAVLAQH
eukprot:6034305-Amphidinium_carterae.2